jgi:hypothetical protein
MKRVIVPKKRKTMKISKQSYENPSSFDQEIIAAAEKSAAAQEDIAQDFGDLTGEPAAGQERALADFHGLEGILASLDGPEPLLREHGYNRPFVNQKRR